MGNTSISFADLFDFADIFIECTLRSVDSNIIVKALCYKDENARNIFYRNMSKKKAELLKQKLLQNLTNTVSVKDAEDAQKKILDVLFEKYHPSLIYKRSKDDINHNDDKIDIVNEVNESINKFYYNLLSNKYIKDTYATNYYETLMILYRFSKIAIAQGVLEIENHLDDINDEYEFMKLCFRFILDGNDEDVIERIMSNYIERTHNHDLKIIKEIQLKGILYIQKGMNTNELMFIVTSSDFIKDDDINKARNAYINGDNTSFDKLFSDKIFLSSIESKKIVGTRLLKAMLFIHKSLEYNHVMRHYGHSILENFLNNELVEQRDVFEFGIYLAIDTDRYDIINDILENIILSKNDYLNQKYFYEAQKAAVLSICAGENPRLLFEIILSFFDGDVQKSAREIFKEYFN
jgi:hypothetical protein